jgi:PPOX class probable FMN-dependent enzyme
MMTGSSEGPGPTITSVDQLRSIYADPPAATRGKLDSLDTHCRSWIGLSPLVFVATADAGGNCDVGPKGGPPGFVKVLNDNELAWADLSGNNKIDGMRNLITSGGIALVFLIPGVMEVLRVNGRATVTTDPAIAQTVAIGRVVPRVSIVVKVQEAWVHCGKALRRAGTWDMTRWPEVSSLPSYAQMVKDHYRLTGIKTEDLDSALQRNYREHQWLPGGGDPYRDTGL